MPHKLTKEELQALCLQAKVIASAVRNNLEEFHVKHLSDQQMAELNPLIRSAVFTVLHATVSAREGSASARQWLEFQRSTVPSYWEDPVLMDDYKP